MITHMQDPEVKVTDQTKKEKEKTTFQGVSGKLSSPSVDLVLVCKYHVNSFMFNSPKCFIFICNLSFAL